MEEKTKLIFKAYLTLSVSEQENFQKAVRDYNTKTLFEQRNYSEAFNKSLGPIMGAKCALCGN